MPDARVKLPAANGKRTCGPQAPDRGVRGLRKRQVGLQMAAKKSTKPRSKRASKNHVTEDAKTTGNAAEASLTRASIPVKQTEYTKGDQISHPMFGHGTVAAIDVHTLTIEFEGNVVKQILDGYVKPRKP